MTMQRAIGLLLLAVAGIFSLPVAAFFLDGPRSENFIVPAQLAVMALLGALIGRVLPGLAGASPNPRRAIVIGAVIGVLMGLLGILIFFVLLSGLSGA